MEAGAAEAAKAEGTAAAVAADAAAGAAKPPAPPRVCAYCYKQLETVLKCSKCKKRAYCSRDCQRADWGTGQRHKVWCDLPSGEEGVDWEVRPCEYGLGVFALRDIPRLARVMVERPYVREADLDRLSSFTRSPFMDLVPVGADPMKKFRTNALGTGTDQFSVGSVVCLRACRINHACLANADHLYEPATQTIVVYALRDIKAGEQVFITYSPMISVSTEPEERAYNLRNDYGVVCPKDCWCKQRDILRALQQFQRDDAQLSNIQECCTRMTAGEQVALAQRQLALIQRVDPSVKLLQRASMDAYLHTLLATGDRGEAEKLLEGVVSMAATVVGPASPFTTELRPLFEQQAQALMGMFGRLRRK